MERVRINIVSTKRVEQGLQSMGQGSKEEEFPLNWKCKSKHSNVPRSLASAIREWHVGGLIVGWKILVNTCDSGLPYSLASAIRAWHTIVSKLCF